MMGIGAIPLWTTGFAHVEQQSWKKNAPLSFGLINGSSAAGKKYKNLGHFINLFKEPWLDFL